MKTPILISGLIVAGLAATPVLAESGTVNGAAGGAVTGAIVGGPVGAAVGGVVGAIAGTAIDPPPPRVIEYVETQPMPEKVVMIDGTVEVGTKLPQEVVLVTVPDSPEYSYAWVNHQRVIVDPSTYIVVGIAP